MSEDKDGIGAAVGALAVADIVWNGCAYTGMAVGGPVGFAVGWCVGAGLIALGIGAVVKNSKS